MRYLFILIRLPFFILAVGLVTIFIVGVSLPGLLGFGLLIIPIAWLMFVVPFKLIGAAFEDDADGFKEYIRTTPVEYIAAFPAVITEGRDIYISLWRWLIGATDPAKSDRQ